MFLQRLKEEYKALIEYVKMNKENNNDWFKIEANKTGSFVCLIVCSSSLFSNLNV